MSRLLFLIAIAAVVYLLIRSLSQDVPKQDQAEPKTCACAHCGVHLP